MSIFSRLTDIINSNLNALLDKAEDPEKIIRMMIQEMEDTLVEIRSNAARLIAEKKDALRQIDWIDQEQSEWQAKAELAISKNREDLARAALAEKKRLAEKSTTLQESLKQLEENLQRFSDDISQLENKLNDARNRQRTLSYRNQGAQTQLKVKNQLHNQKLNDVLHRFEAAEKKIDAVESEAEAYELGKNKSLKEAFDDLAGEEQLEKELSELKKKVSGKKKK